MPTIALKKTDTSLRKATQHVESTREVQLERTMADTGERSNQVQNVVEEALFTGALSALYKQLFAPEGDDLLRKTNQFVAWLPGGHAVDKGGLRFANGLAGECTLGRADSIAVQKIRNAGDRISQAVARSEAKGEMAQDTPDVIAALEEAEMIREANQDAFARLEQAIDIADLFNQIPDVPNFGKDAPRATALHRSGADVMDVYCNLLRFCDTASYETTPAEIAKIKRLRALFFEEFEEQDTVSGKRVRRWRKSRLLSEYERTMRDYETAETEFQLLCRQATGGMVPGAKMRFSTKGAILRNRVRFAMDQWSTFGRKNDVERVVAYLECQGFRDAGLIKRDLLDKMCSGRLAKPRGGVFYPVALTPPSFVDEDTGWMKLSYSESASDKASTADMSYLAPLRHDSEFLCVLSAAAKGSDPECGGASGHSYRAERIDFKCEYTIVNIERGALFDRAFLTSRMLRLPAGVAPVCDGSVPPNGRMPALATRAIFMRNLLVNIRFAEGDAKSFRDAHSVTGKDGFYLLGFGGFRLDCNNSDSFGLGDAVHHLGGQALRSEGLQLVGLLYDILPECPMPLTDPNLTWSGPGISTEADGTEIAL
ncbi:MAG: hypothetical protein AAF636_09270 [Pseudomonadota bacterium]